MKKITLELDEHELNLLCNAITCALSHHSDRFLYGRKGGQCELGVNGKRLMTISNKLNDILRATRLEEEAS